MMYVRFAPMRPSHARVYFMALLLIRCAPSATLPTKVFSTADGLPRDTILKVVADPHGLVWFCTPEGLSRFDGSYFTNYGIADGLPSAQSNDLLITRADSRWVATNAGLARFEPRSTTAIRFS